MSTNNNPEKYSDILRLLHDFFLDEEVDVTLLPLENINAELAKEGIDTKSLISDTITKITKVKTQKRLATARAKRSKLQELAAIKDKTGSFSNVKQKLLEIISDINKSEPKLASMYFRKLEEVDEEDLQSILEDLLMLEDDEDEL